MAINLSDNIQTNAPKPSDSRYLNNLTPYTTVAEANAALTGGVGGVRYIGLTVNIDGVEYWYKDGIDDSDLVLKTTSGGGKLNWTGSTLYGIGTYMSPSGICANQNFLYNGGNIIYCTTNGSFVVDSGGTNMSIIGISANNGGYATFYNVNGEQKALIRSYQYQGEQAFFSAGKVRIGSYNWTSRTGGLQFGNAGVENGIHFYDGTGNTIELYKGADNNFWIQRGTAASSGTYFDTSGLPRVTDGTNTTSINQNSIYFSRNSANYIWGITAGGYLALGVNGDTVNVTNSALLLCSNKTAIFGGDAYLKSGNDLILNAAAGSCDTGDIVFNYNAGAGEWARLYNSSVTGCLHYRSSADTFTGRYVYHSGNLSSFDNATRIPIFTGDDTQPLCGHSGLVYTGNQKLRVGVDSTASNAGILINQAGTGNAVVEYADENTYAWYAGQKVSDHTFRISRSSTFDDDPDFTINTGGNTIVKNNLSVCSNFIFNTYAYSLGNAVVLGTNANCIGVVYIRPHGYNNTTCQMVIGTGEACINTNTCICGELNVGKYGNHASGDTFIRFNGDRPWVFCQRGDDSGAVLVMKPESDGKSFLILGNGDDYIAQFYSNSTGGASTAHLFHGGVKRLSTESYGARIDGCLTLCQANPYIRWCSNSLNLKSYDNAIPVLNLRGSTSYGTRFAMYCAGDASVGLQLRADDTSCINNSLAIGASSAAEKLTVNGNIQIGRLNEYRFGETVTGSARARIFSTQNEFSGDYNGLGFSIGSNDRTSPSMYIAGGGGTTVAGHVGIGTLPTEKLHVNGNIKAAVHMIADTYYCSSDNAAVLGTSSSGTVYLRPVGASVSTCESTFSCSIACIKTPLCVAGDITATGMVMSSAYFRSTSINAIIGGTGAGTIYLRPNGYNSATYQSTFNTSLATVNTAFCGTVCVNSPTVCGTTIVISPTVYGSTLVCGATVCGTTLVQSPTVYGSTLVCGTTVCGTSVVRGATVCSAGSTYSCTFYRSTTAAAVLGTASNGTVYIRPLCADSAVCQATFTCGLVQFNTQFCVADNVAGYSILTNRCMCAVDFVATSDCRKKKNITPISNALSMISCLCGVCYEFCEDESSDIGLIAQDVLKVEPRLVSEAEPSEEEKENFGIYDKTYGIKYDKFAGVFVEAIKNLKQENDCLNNKINQLVDDIEKLKERL